MCDHAPPEGMKEARRYEPRGKAFDLRFVVDSRDATLWNGMQKVTRWEVDPPDRVTFHDEVYRNGRLVVLGREMYRFLGGDQPGWIVEVTVLRKPVSLVSRVGLALLPGISLRSTRSEASLFEEIDRAFKERK